jgi:glycine cleavage system protein P-like pyridoxal-binding family
MKGLFIPGITAKMFRDASVESVAELMADGEIYDIDYQEPCKDCISRTKDAINKQVVKEQMIKYGFHAPDMTVTEFVEDLLPIAPTRKKGKWIVEIWNNREHHICSDCQRVVDYEPCYHYCPYCGEEKESEE